MSNIRSKASEIKAAGAAKRGDFTPNGVPLRLYNYWLDQTITERGRAIRDGRRQENFCHFWRVVAIWAPLAWIMAKIDKYHEWIAGGIALTGLAIFLYATISSGSFFLIMGFLLGGLAFVAAIVFAVDGLVTLHKRYPERFKFVAKWLGISVGAVLLGGAITLMVLSAGWAGVGAIGITAALTAVFILNLGNIADLIEGIRAKREAEELARQEAAEEYFLTHGHLPQGEVKQPGKVAKFFGGVADFIILISQVVRVGKWKICPIVKIQD